MAIPTTKSTFKDYCFRSLGSGVVDINVSDDQADDRIDEAIQYFSEYHYEGVERMYLKHLITQADVDRAITNETSTATDTVDSSVSSTWLSGKNYIPLPSSVISVVQVFPLTGTGSDNYAWNNSVVDGVSFVPSASSYYTVTSTLGSCDISDSFIKIIPFFISILSPASPITLLI